MLACLGCRGGDDTDDLQLTDGPPPPSRPRVQGRRPWLPEANLHPRHAEVDRCLALICTVCSHEFMPRRELIIEDQRADVVRRMSGPGARRVELLQELAELDRTLQPLVVEATELGVTTRRIGTLIGLAASAVSNWARKGYQRP
jgi:hypothetical protein